MSIQNFLIDAKKNYNTANNKYYIIVGNQSADLDSVVCAVSWAYYLTCMSNNIFIPFVNNKREIFATKNIFKFLQDEFNLELDNFLFLNDDWRRDSDALNLVKGIFLVDHNKLDKKETELNFSPLVQAILDHHEDEGLFLHASPRTINNKIGSTTSILVHIISTARFELTKEWACFLSCAILYDTQNLTYKTDLTDRFALEYIKKFNNQNIFEKMSAQMQCQQDDLSIELVVQQDLKLFDKVQ